MKLRCLIPAFLLSSTIFVSCTKEYDCSDATIQPAFIGFVQPDIDTFVLRKFKANDNYQTLIDTFVVNYGEYSVYQASNDTTIVFVQDANNDGKEGIKSGYDWQIIIPSQSKIVFVSDIVIDKKTGKRSSGIFNLDKVANCTNRVFSAKVNNQVINFSDTAGYYLFIH